MARNVKVVMTGNSWATKAGDEVSVSAETAEALIREGHAYGASPAAKRIEAAVEESPGSE